MNKFYKTSERLYAGNYKTLLKDLTTELYKWKNINIPGSKDII